MAESRTRAVLAAIPLTGVLCAAAGAIDVIAYIRFGKIFIANMTGNTVLFAASLVLHQWREAGLRIGVVVAFLIGVSIAHTLLQRLTSGRERRGRLIVLAIEFAALVALGTVFPTPAVRVVLLVVLAIAMGMQNNAFRQIGPIRLNTAFITGDLEHLGEALVEAEASNKRREAKRREARLRAGIFLTTWIAYGLGALVGAYGAVHIGDKALWIPAAMIGIAAAMVFRSPASAYGTRKAQD